MNITFEGPTTIKDMASSFSSSSLFPDKLPAELRNRVYHLVLTPAEPINFDSANIDCRTGLLQTCKQIRIEASQIFCATNRFDITWRAGQRNHLVKWITSIDRTAAQHLRLTIKFDISTWRMAAILRCGNHAELRMLGRQELLPGVRELGGVLQAVGVPEGNITIDSRHASGPCPFPGLCLAGSMHDALRVALEVALRKRGLCSELVLWHERTT